mmetsp:Transcript_33213/g.99364  ORF Transcript_33213/g.99364 Transcript_33213/m.99364 type:complete len:434 (-) Transcript_33213:2688-3989(-)
MRRIARRHEHVRSLVDERHPARQRGRRILVAVRVKSRVAERRGGRAGGRPRQLEHMEAAAVAEVHIDAVDAERRLGTAQRVVASRVDLVAAAARVGRARGSLDRLARDGRPSKKQQLAQGLEPRLLPRGHVPRLLDGRDHLHLGEAQVAHRATAQSVGGDVQGGGPAAVRAGVGVAHEQRRRVGVRLDNAEVEGGCRRRRPRARRQPVEALPRVCERRAGRVVALLHPRHAQNVGQEAEVADGDQPAAADEEAPEGRHALLVRKVAVQLVGGVRGRGCGHQQRCAGRVGELRRQVGRDAVVVHRCREQPRVRKPRARDRVGQHRAQRVAVARVGPKRTNRCCRRLRRRLRLRHHHLSLQRDAYSACAKARAKARHVRRPIARRIARGRLVGRGQFDVHALVCSVVPPARGGGGAQLREVQRRRELRLARGAHR